MKRDIRNVVVRIVAGKEVKVGRFNLLFRYKLNGIRRIRLLAIALGRIPTRPYRATGQAGCPRVTDSGIDKLFRTRDVRPRIHGNAFDDLKQVN